MSIHKPQPERPQGVPTLSTGATRRIETPCAAMVPMTGPLAARLDACPECLVNTEVPYGSFEPPTGGLVALYRCTDCGHRWHTSWAHEEVA